jgi:ABC-type iron transport system FetAB ATPase subunit
MQLRATSLGRTVEGRTLFDGLDLEISPGEVLAIRGPSGCGKTTLLRALAGLDPLESGAVTLDGRTPEQWGWPCWRAEVRYLAQKVPVFPGRPRDLTGLLGTLKSWAHREVVDPVQLALRWQLPAETWDKPWSRLSGGEQQRVMLAITLASAPTVLLLDEPTTGLDPAAAAAVEADLAGRTALWVTHDEQQAARVAGRVLEMS